MGISLQELEKLDGLYNAFGSGGVAVLDIGTSNLYSAAPEHLIDFVRKFRAEPAADIAEWADRVSKGSSYDSVSGGSNGAWVGELLEAAGMRYESIDIAPMYNTSLIDLNFQPCPPDWVGAFDLVLNYGTTEHIMNQFNAFRVIHDATKVGGLMIHSLPSLGYFDHGYLAYTPRFFFDLCSYNGYELVDFLLSDPSPCSHDAVQPLRNYATYFPALAERVARIDAGETSAALRSFQLNDASISLVFRKVSDRPFMGALEASTASVAVSNTVLQSYSTAQLLPDELTTPEGVAAEVAALRDAVTGLQAQVDALRDKQPRGLCGILRRAFS